MLLIGQSLECWRPPLADAASRRDPAPLLARARRQLAAGARALDVNFGATPRDGLAEDFRWTALTLREALPGVPLFLDCGDLEALAAVVTAVQPPAVVNAVPLDAGATGPALALLAAAAAQGAGVVFSPRAMPERDDPQAILDAGEQALALAERAGVHGPLSLDCLAYPAVTHPAACRRSLTWLSALRDSERTVLHPLIAVGNVPHSAPPALGAALEQTYVVLAVAAGASALILRAEDSSIMSLVRVMTTSLEPATAIERWALAVATARMAGLALPSPPAHAELRAAWDLLAGSGRPTAAQTTAPACRC